MRIIKNLLISVLAILLLMSIVSACNDKKEEVGFDSNGFKYELNETETGYIVSRGDFKGDEIIIPAEYNGLPVTEIKTFSYFNYETPILKVEIPNTVTKIWDYAFVDCPIISISIPSSVVSMGYSAFNGCSYLTDITIPFVGAKMGETEASEKTLFGYIFGTKQYDTGVEITQNYSANETITYIIPSSLKMVTVLSGDILYGAFSNCFMRELNVGDGVINIESYAFDGCYSLTSVSIGNSVKEIPASLFYNCNLLTSVTIGNSVESIGSSAFSGCSSLASVNYTEDINSWANINFDNAGANPICFAEKLYINEKKVTTAEITIGQISNYAFYNCSSLTSVTIGKSVKSIGIYAFYKCNSLASVRFKNTTGWYRARSETETVGTIMDVTNLSNNAKNLTETYNFGNGGYTDYYWKRNV